MPRLALMQRHEGGLKEPGHEAEAARERYGLVLALAVIVLSAILFFARLGARALWSSEFRWAEIAREMLRTGNYFWPTINGHLYYDKPLGSYWFVLASSWITGRLDETAVRLPCAIAGLVAVALLILLVRRLYDLRTAALAGFILATSFSFVFFSRHASADVETITGELAALLLFCTYAGTPARWWVVALWIIMAVTSLTKGLLGFALPVIVIGSFATLADGWAEFGNHVLSGSPSSRVRWLVERNRWLFNWHSTVAITIALAIYLTPFQISKAVSGSNLGLAMAYRENLVRFFRPFDHRGPVYLYVYVIFALMAPWSLFLPAALVQAHRQRRLRAAAARPDRFVLIFFWATFIFFTLSGSRRSYYILPILPAGAILIARLLNGTWDSMSALSKWLTVAAYLVLAAVIALGFITMLPPSWILAGAMAKLPPAPDRWTFAILWLATLGAVIYAVAKPDFKRITLSVATAAYLSMVYIFVFATPAADLYRGEKPFALAVRKALGPAPANLALYKTVGPLFYLDPPKPLPEFTNDRDLRDAVAENKVRWVIARRRDLASIGMPAEIVLSEASFPWEPPSQVRNKVVLAKIDSNEHGPRARTSATDLGGAPAPR